MGLKTFLYSKWRIENRPGVRWDWIGRAMTGQINDISCGEIQVTAFRIKPVTSNLHMATQQYWVHKTNSSCRFVELAFDSVGIGRSPYICKVTDERFQTILSKLERLFDWQFHKNHWDITFPLILMLMWTLTEATDLCLQDFMYSTTVI